MSSLSSARLTAVTSRASVRSLFQRWQTTLTTPTESHQTTHYRITLRRSAIGLPAHTKRILESMGLRKRLQSVYRPKRADIAGMVLAVKELVHVENVRRLDGGMVDAAMKMAEEIRLAETESEREMIEPMIVRDEDAIWVNENEEVVDWGGKQARKAPRGYTVVGNLVNEGRHQDILINSEQKE